MKKINVFCTGVFIILTFSAFVVRAQHSAEPLNVKKIKSVVDSVGRLLSRYYVFEDKGRVMEKHIQSKWKSGIYKKLSNPAELAGQLHKDLQQMNPDIHMAVHFDPWFDKVEADKESQKDTINAIELRVLRQNNFLLKRVEVLDGNIGYFYLSGFNSRVKESKPTLQAAMAFLKNTSAMIIDLRENNGGSPEMVREIESYFFREKVHMMDIIDRVDDKTYAMWADPLYSDNHALSMPVYILTARTTASAAEDFAYGMRAVNRAVVVGEKTAGGAHLTRPFSAGHGFVVAIPFARSLNPYSKSNWEGTGVKPDIETSSADALQKALETIFEKQVKAATDDHARRRIQWLQQKVRADYANQRLADELISRYTGVFEGGLEFYIQDEKLFCRNSERGNAIFSMRRISDTHFLLDENVIVEFVRNASGQFQSINMLWKDGWVTTKPRHK